MWLKNYLNPLNRNRENPWDEENQTKNELKENLEPNYWKVLKESLSKLHIAFGQNIKNITYYLSDDKENYTKLYLTDSWIEIFHKEWDSTKKLSIYKYDDNYITYSSEWNAWESYHEAAVNPEEFEGWISSFTKNADKCEKEYDSEVL